jgi:uncharacterized repeat protein (TIGR04138 family)
MVDQPAKTLQDLVKHVGQYPEEAYLFVREGLSYAADRIHGPETEAHRHLQQFLIQHGVDWDDLVAKYHANELPPPVEAAIEAAGGCDKLNRHVSGRELCWALRDYAIDRWGLLARLVLESWNVRRTTDLGRIVFGFIDFDMMRKQSEDSMEDFEEVYSFDDAFDASLMTGSNGEENE